MLQAPTICTLQYRSTELADAHPEYTRLLRLACECHNEGRNPNPINERDITLARLYCYAYRKQVIGVFHATRVLIEDLPEPEGPKAHIRLRVREWLAELANISQDPVPSDFKALLSTFYRYEYAINRLMDEMRDDERQSKDSRLTPIVDRFRSVVTEVRQCNGIHLSQDTFAPEQASFIVPNLGITIIPLVYGDYHSWNLAWLDPKQADVPFHLHDHGVEIHLGFGPMRGHIVLDQYQGLTDEGYALPIPPKTRHGYVNASNMEHHLPFIFGSMKRGGWGVFFDVDPQPIPLEELTPVAPDSRQLNSCLRIEREIDKMTRLPIPLRKCICPAHLTDRDGTGGLALNITRAPAKGIKLTPERFLAVSVVHGSGIVKMAGIEQTVSHHDHFGVPAGVEVEFVQTGEKPFVLLDSDLMPSK